MTPTTWDEAGDVAFFVMTAALFSASFTYGASVLLASYDSDDTPRPAADPRRQHRRELGGCPRPRR